MLKLWILAVLFCFDLSDTLVIPNELPTILSLIYSNIPTVKKGTDSRFGWGFRLGDRADFQVLVELGPQTNTQPLGNQPSSTNAKRNVLYAQRQHEKTHISNTDGGKWLENWSAYIRDGRPYQVKTKPPIKSPKIPTNSLEKLNEIPKTNQGDVAVDNPVLGIGEIDAKLVIPEDKDEDKVKIKISTTTSKEDALDNVAKVTWRPRIFTSENVQPPKNHQSWFITKG
ncbi:hypothetical protein QE152_g1550 [Popillia japonica]|uniref:Uncharacterized protein n=1 Tax=Popillia japonica TaxID=7064 RepID=A0AAW1N1S0_POPJA